MSKDVWCSLPWIHACVRTDNNLRPCCRYKGDGDLTFDDVEAKGVEAFNSPYWTKLRQDMLDGTPRSECVKCYTEERNTNSIKPSMRLFLNKRYSHAVTRESATDQFHSLRYVEMSLDNICNLQCRMCNSAFSSRLQQRDQYLNTRVYKKLEPNWHKFDSCDLSQLEYVKILGGEPFITPNFEPFVDWLSSRVDLSQVTLEIATNGTGKPRPQLVEKLRQFHYINVNVSLDSVHPVNDYQREGSNWESILAMYHTMIKTFPNIVPSVHMTQSIFTANHLADSLEYLDNHSIGYTVDFVIDPDHLNIQCATPEVKQWIRESNSHHAKALSLVNNHLNTDKHTKQTWQDLEYHVTMLDDYYNKQLADYNPVLAQHLGRI